MRTRLIATTLLLATLSAPAAHAHAFLEHASPLVGGTVAAAPHEVAFGSHRASSPPLAASR